MFRKLDELAEFTVLVLSNELFPGAMRCLNLLPPLQERFMSLKLQVLQQHSFWNTSTFHPQSTLNEWYATKENFNFNRTALNSQILRLQSAGRFSCAGRTLNGRAHFHESSSTTRPHVHRGHGRRVWATQSPHRQMTFDTQRVHRSELVQPIPAPVAAPRRRAPEFELVSS